MWTWHRQRRALTYALYHPNFPYHVYAAVIDDFGCLVIVAYTPQKVTPQ